MRKFPSDIPYVFDNDCLASFPWVNRTDFLHDPFPGQIKAPETVCGFLKISESEGMAGEGKPCHPWQSQLFPYPLQSSLVTQLNNMLIT